MPFFLPLLSQQARADTLLAQTLEPRAEIRADYVPAGLETIYAHASEQLLSFLKTKTYAALPLEVRSRLDEHRIVITLRRSPIVDGLFLDDGGPDLSISMRHSELTTENAQQIVAHEFFHAVHHLINPGQPPWIREGLAQLFEFRVLGRFNEQNMKAALADLNTPLEGKYVVGQESRAQYGHDLLYFYYVWSNCGRDELFWKIAARDIDSALTQIKRPPGIVQCENFAQSALHFEIARAQNEFDNTVDRNDQIHFLWPTTLPTAHPRTALSAKELDALERFQPVTILPEARLPGHIPENVRIFWLQKFFPYAVTSAPPKSGKWIGLLFKI